MIERSGYRRPSDCMIKRSLCKRQGEIETSGCRRQGDREAWVEVTGRSGTCRRQSVGGESTGTKHLS